MLAIIVINIFLVDEKQDNLTLHGKISSDYSYTLRTFYKSKSSLPFCKTGYLYMFGSISSKSKFFDYSPKIDGNKHFISIPINYNGLNICNYKLERIALTYHYGSSNTLFEKSPNLEYVGYGIRPISSYRTTQLLPVLIEKKENDYTIDFHSHNDYDIYHANKIKKEKIKKEREWQERKIIRKKENLEREKLAKPYRKAKSDIQLISKLFVMFRKLNYRTPDESEGKKLLQLEGLSIFSNKKDFKSFIKKLKKEVVYKNGSLVDPWGNPYQYLPEQIIHSRSSRNNSKTKNALIYSYGRKGFASKNIFFFQSVSL